ncbi:MAG: Helicase associated domain protein [Eubacterium sp.]|nr:Helicase associated domain protein [Eubacterium sp.]
MSIDLFEHNKTAYEAAAAMLAETGKAAVIHPTGTGKSFIGFKLCEDNPDKTVCWLSPSEYIFKTQLENLKKTGAKVPQNIKFFTYAKLVYMSDDELAEIAPDIFIIDEMHRTGSQVWNKRVTALLEMFPNVPMLGMSATNVRYLDNQRDMAEELFDGNIASEMTLGEAIVRGILKAPLYISTVFSYQKELEKYTRMAKMPKYKAVRDKAQEYLEELRRTIEKADGLDVIFEKYMPDKSGKYVAFCANREHLDEMISHVDEWFGKIDNSPKVYKVYSDNPEASAEFADFKADKSENLKLLFCIDMLNEGVHLDDIDGVILFRPTVSPTVYKQQIGRALTAGKDGTPVIFDIINNFENLYSMGAIEQEMACAINYYNSLGDGDKIVVDKFEIIGVVNNCVELFDKLNESFTAGWDTMYACACEYFAEHGNLEMPRRYKTESGLSLGNWLDTQRGVRSGKINGILTEERISKLDALNMRWESVSDMNWEKNFAAAVEYAEKYGELNPKADYVTENGIRLGSWAANIRTYRKCGIHRNYLTDERIIALNKIGMVWDAPNYYFEKKYAALLEYFHTHGDLDVPVDYVSPDGVKLGMSVRSLRVSKKKGLLTEGQVSRLNEIGMLWDDKYTRNWEIGFEHARAYFVKNGNLDVPTMFVCEDGFKLGAWIANHREKSGTRITEERRERLNSIGMIWAKPTFNELWETRFEYAKKYYEEHGNLEMPADYTAGGTWISKWLNEQKHIYRGRRKGKSLTDEQIKKLESIGFQWLDNKEIVWLKRYEMLKKYKDENGNVDVPKNYIAEDGFKLGIWLRTQVTRCKKGECTDEQIRLLREVGVDFEDKNAIWLENYKAAKKFFEENGHLNVPQSYTAENGNKLCNWLNNQKYAYKKGKMTKEHFDLLKNIGMRFDTAVKVEKNFDGENVSAAG